MLSSITEITLFKFIKCLCDHDLSQLGSASPEKLQAIWEGVYEQFMESMQDKKGLYRIRLLGKINHLEFTYKLIHLCVKYLSQAYDREIIDLLQKHVRVTGAFNPEDQENYFLDLQVVLNRAQKILIDIQNKEAEYNLLRAKDAPGSGPLKKDFDRLIAQVSIHAKFHIDKKAIMTSEFVEYYNLMREDTEAMEDHYEKQKHAR